MFTQANRLSSRTSLLAEMRKSGDPFEVELLPRTFYYPSQQKVLPGDQRKICLSPNQRKQDHSTKSPADEHFLQQTNHMKIHEVPTRENGTTDPDQSSSSKFDESWPSTERAMVSTPEAETEISGMTKTASSDGSDVHLRPPPDSTLARYIHRFRNAPPSSRQARDYSYFDSGKEGEFWWLSPSPPSSSTPKEGTPPDRLLGPTPRPSLSPKLKRNADRRGASPASPISKTRSTLSPSKSSLEGLDAKTADLQQRARTLLEKSESTLESSSSEAHKPKRITKQGPPKDRIPKDAPSVLTPHGALMERQQRQLQPRPAPPPEEDILYQWRLARKMERAQEQAAKWGPARSTLPLGSTRPCALSSASTLLRTTPTTPVPSQMDTMYQRPALHVPTPLLVPGVPAGASSSPAKTQTTFSIPTPVVSDREEIPPQIIPSHSEITTQAPTLSSQHSQIATEQSSEAHQIMSSAGQATAVATERPVVSWPVHEAVLVDQDRFESADVPSHMHLSCDILPCPHQRTLIERRGADKLPLSSPVVESILGKAHKEERDTDRGSKPHRSVIRDSHEARHTPKTSRQKEFEESRSKAGSQVLKGMTVALPENTTREKPKIKEAGKQKSKAKREIPQGPGPTDMLSGVIGQVISERLFSTPRSSTSSSLSGSEEGVELREPELQHHGHASEEDDADVSSDHEFPDDEVLKMLRQRARQYREQLREIDRKLNHQTPKPM